MRARFTKFPFFPLLLLFFPQLSSASSGLLLHFPLCSSLTSSAHRHLRIRTSRSIQPASLALSRRDPPSHFLQRPWPSQQALPADAPPNRVRTVPDEHFPGGMNGRSCGHVAAILCSRPWSSSAELSRAVRLGTFFSAGTKKPLAGLFRGVDVRRDPRLRGLDGLEPRTVRSIRRSSPKRTRFCRGRSSNSCTTENATVTVVVFVRLAARV